MYFTFINVIIGVDKIKHFLTLTYPKHIDLNVIYNLLPIHITKYILLCIKFDFLYLKKRKKLSK